jgi:hypothetical protein
MVVLLQALDLGKKVPEARLERWPWALLVVLPAVLAALSGHRLRALVVRQSMISDG